MRIDSASSVPPHIHPPIAQVPSAIRETLKGAVRYSISALLGLISEFMTFLVGLGPLSAAISARNSFELEVRPCP